MKTVCPHCGCGYWVYGNTPYEAICHDCGYVFDVEPDPEVDERARPV
jgi:transposase-like protein